MNYTLQEKHLLVFCFSSVGEKIFLKEHGVYSVYGLVSDELMKYLEIQDSMVNSIINSTVTLYLHNH